MLKLLKRTISNIYLISNVLCSFMSSFGKYYLLLLIKKFVV